MERFASNLITKVENIDKELKNIRYNIKASSVNVHNVFSKFQNLSHQKFTENVKLLTNDHANPFFIKNRFSNFFSSKKKKASLCTR